MSIVGDVGSTNYELLCLLKNFDEEFAWSQFIATYSPMIRNCCQGWGLHPHEVDEVQSLVNGRLLTFFHSSETRVHTSFRGFLAKVVENEIRTFLKNKAADRLVSIQSLPDLTEPYLLSAQQREELDQVETDLTEKLRTIGFVMAHVHLRVSDKTWRMYWEYGVLGHAVDEVADRFGVSKATVFKSHQRVARVIREVSDSLCEAERNHG